MSRRIDIYQIEEDFLINKEDTIWMDERLLGIRDILNNSELVKPYERRIFLLYLEMGSLRKAEAVCGISHKNINEIYHRVRNIILENYDS